MAKKKLKKSLCDKCNGLCCRYFALPIDTPEDREDYDDIRWYLCHKDITVFKKTNDEHKKERVKINNVRKELSDKFSFNC